MDTLFSGVVMATGEHGTGKTTFALEAGDPSRMIFVDDDVKGRMTINQIRRDGIEFGRYIDYVGETQGMKNLERHMYVRRLIDSVKEGEFDVLVWDTWPSAAKTCHSYVVAHPHEFRDKDGWASMGKIRNGEEWQEAYQLEARLIAGLQRKVPLVILLSHLKNHYLNNAQTGKLIPQTSKAVDRVCNLRLWLRYNPDGSGKPIALVLKNIDLKVYDPDLRRLRTEKILPTRVQLEDGERSLWDAIQRYWNEPAGSRDPLPHEIPNEFEQSIVDGSLTDDQRLMWLQGVQARKQEEEEERQLLFVENAARAKELKEEGAPLPKIAQELGVSVPEVLTLLAE